MICYDSTLFRNLIHCMHPWIFHLLIQWLKFALKTEIYSVPCQEEEYPCIRLCRYNRPPDQLFDVLLPSFLLWLMLKESWCDIQNIHVDGIISSFYNPDRWWHHNDVTLRHFVIDFVIATGNNKRATELMNECNGRC